MEAKYNLWIENNGIVVMSLWRANFLRAIAETASLKAAAEKMNVTYHEAQLKLDEMETGLGYKLVTYIPCDDQNDQIGLTPEGERLLVSFAEFSAGFDKDVIGKFSEKFQ